MEYAAKKCAILKLRVRLEFFDIIMKLGQEKVSHLLTPVHTGTAALPAVYARRRRTGSGGVPSRMVTTWRKSSQKMIFRV